jgi:hypothetical protein
MLGTIILVFKLGLEELLLFLMIPLRGGGNLGLLLLDMGLNLLGM